MILKKIICENSFEDEDYIDYLCDELKKFGFDDLKAHHSHSRYDVTSIDLDFNTLINSSLYKDFAAKNDVVIPDIAKDMIKTIVLDHYNYTDDLDVNIDSYFSWRVHINYKSSHPAAYEYIQTFLKNEDMINIYKDYVAAAIKDKFKDLKIISRVVDLSSRSNIEICCKASSINYRSIVLQIFVDGTMDILFSTVGDNSFIKSDDICQYVLHCLPIVPKSFVDFSDTINFVGDLCHELTKNETEYVWVDTLED